MCQCKFIILWMLSIMLPNWMAQFYFAIHCFVFCLYFDFVSARAQIKAIVWMCALFEWDSIIDWENCRKVMNWTWVLKKTFDIYTVKDLFGFEKKEQRQCGTHFFSSFKPSELPSSSSCLWYLHSEIILIFLTWLKNPLYVL